MFAGFFKIALRNISRQKVYTLINILGLATSLACFILIVFWVKGELGYENFNTKAERIYLVFKRTMVGGQQNSTNSSTPYLLGQRAGEQLPEVEKETRIANMDAVVTNGQDFYNEKEIFAVDSTFFQIFDFQFISGNPESALNSPYSVVITKDIAFKYFGKDNPIGKELRFDKDQRFLVSAVIQNLPENTHLRFDLLVPIKTIFEKNDDAKDWYHHFIKTYVLAAQGVSQQVLSEKMTRLIRSYMTHENTIELVCQPIKRLHLYSLDGKNQGIQYVYIFSLIGVLILLIACINYMNLSTSMAMRRSREVGLKKVIGANRKQLMWQFLGEAFIQTFLSIIVSLALVEMVSPLFEQITGKSIDIPYASTFFILGITGLLILTSILAGAFPAFFLSSFQPSSAFKGFSQSGHGKGRLRKILVITQFSISIALIISTFIIYSQLNYIRSKELGFNKENVISIPIIGDIGKKYDFFRNELLKNPGIKSTCRSSALPSEVRSIVRGIEWEGKEDNTNVSFALLSVDHDFVETMGLTLTEGRTFTRDNKTDTATIMFNEKAIGLIGYKEPIGKMFGKDSNFQADIIGVVKDFNSLPLTFEVEPLMIMMWPQYYNLIMVRMTPGDVHATISYIEKTWKEIAPESPFEYDFLDKQIEDSYKNEQRIAKLAGMFAFLAIFITCIGLFGLASHAAQQKTKEIGIRKVFGAPVNSLMLMFLKNFIIWVILANIIAWPIAWIFARQWLQNFAYRVEISWPVFILSGFIALVIAIVTVAYKSWSAASKNPIDSLKYE